MKRQVVVDIRRCGRAALLCTMNPGLVCSWIRSMDPLSPDGFARTDQHAVPVQSVYELL